jgi:hypothetical protein
MEVICVLCEVRTKSVCVHYIISSSSINHHHHHAVMDLVFVALSSLSIAIQKSKMGVLCSFVL